MATANPYGDSSTTPQQQPLRYSTLSINSVATLPLYPTIAEYDISESRAAQSQHKYDIFHSGKNTPWAALHLSSKAPASSQRPHFIGFDNVSGAVILGLLDPQSISSVKLVLRGHMVTSSLSEGSYRFLEHPVPIYDKTTGDASAKKQEGKLQGRYEWPFSFPFPTEYTLPSPSKKRDQAENSPPTYPIPQTLVERQVNVCVVYELVLRIVSGLFKREYKFRINVLYIPLIKALLYQLDEKLLISTAPIYLAPLRILIVGPGCLW